MNEEQRQEIRRIQSRHSKLRLVIVLFISICCAVLCIYTWNQLCEEQHESTNNVPLAVVAHECQAWFPKNNAQQQPIIGVRLEEHENAEVDKVIGRYLSGYTIMEDSAVFVIEQAGEFEQTGAPMNLHMKLDGDFTINWIEGILVRPGRKKHYPPALFFMPRTTDLNNTNFIKHDRTFILPEQHENDFVVFIAYVKLNANRAGGSPYPLVEAKAALRSF